MTIGLDYDDTYTLDPPFWDAFVELAEARGHRVVGVTFRAGGNPVLERFPVEVVYTGGAFKRAFCAGLVLVVDVWIEDLPEMVSGWPARSG